MKRPDGEDRRGVRGGGTGEIPRREFVVGIDVGGAKKGYHGAVLFRGEDSVASLFHFTEPDEVVAHLEALGTVSDGELRAVALDAPSGALRKSPETRPAERELVKEGYRVLWTPHKKEQIQGWMENGERLWKALRRAFPGVKFVESFPSASFDGIHNETLSLPLHLLAGRGNRKWVPDFLDAALAAGAALRSLEGATRIFGEGDPMGPIHVLNQPRTVYTLCLVVRGGRILLGMKKRGFGEGLWNGFGGKVEPGESLVEAVRRELQEEAGILGRAFQKRGHILFSFEGKERLLEGHIYLLEEFEGTPVSTEEMDPAWFSLKEIPYDGMWEDDRLWFPLLLEGSLFRGHFHFDSQERLASYTLRRVESLR